MHKLLTYTVFFSLICTGCATSEQTSEVFWIDEPIPEIWEINSVWDLILLDQEGSIQRILTVRFTDRDDVDACFSGEIVLKVLEILEERPERSAEALNKPVYFVAGNTMFIDLNANMCDNYYPMNGRLTELGVAGNHGWSHMFGSETVGSFYGFPSSNFH